MARDGKGGRRGLPVRVVALTGAERHTVSAKENLEVVGHCLEDGVRVSDQCEVVKETVDPNSDTRPGPGLRQVYGVNALGISGRGPTGDMRDVNGVAQTQRFDVLDEHVEENIKPERGKTAPLLAARVNGKCISEAREGAGHARETGLKGIQERKARGIKTQGSKGIPETVIRGRVKGLGYISGEDMDGGVGPLSVLKKKVEDSSSGVRGLARAGTALIVGENATAYLVTDGEEALVEEGRDELVKGTKEGDRAVGREESGVARAFIEADDFTPKEAVRHTGGFEDSVNEAKDKTKEEPAAELSGRGESVVRVCLRAGYGVSARGRGGPEKGLQDIILDAVRATGRITKVVDEGDEGGHVNRADEGGSGPKSLDRRCRGGIEGDAEPGLSGVSEEGRGTGDTHGSIICAMNIGEACRGGVDNVIAGVAKGGGALEGGATEGHRLKTLTAAVLFVGEGDEEITTVGSSEAL